MLDLRIQPERLWDSLMEMAQIGATTKGGCNRQALTDEDKRGRELFIGWCRALGCGVRVDAIGNIFCRREGSNPELPPVLIGNHLDTQRPGGGSMASTGCWPVWRCSEPWKKTVSRSDGRWKLSHGPMKRAPGFRPR